MKALAEIAAEQRAWSERNFPNNTPLEPLSGIIEELGELAHARLKRRQGIRGSAEEHIAAERDAIGDVAIYLLDFIWRSGLRLYADIPDRSGGPRSEDAATGTFLEMADMTGRLAQKYASGNRSGQEYEADRLLLGLVIYSSQRGWSFLEIVNETWARVGKRDWVADPANAASGEAK